MKVISPMAVRGTGSIVPEKILSNEHFASYLDTDNDWILQRTGIQTRHQAAAEQSTSTFATEAGRQALADAGIAAEDVDFVIVCTCTSDYTIPSTACLVQRDLGLGQVPIMDLGATCSGMIYGMSVASQLLQSGAYRNILLIGADSLTRFTDYEDRTTCILFGDGAGAVVLGRSERADRGVVYSKLGGDGALWNLLWVPAGGSKEPSTTRTVNERLHYMRMRGRELFKVAVGKMQALVDEAMAETGASADQLALVIPHQSNRRIIEAVRSRLKLPPEKMAVNIDRFGNTSSASIGLAFDEAWKTERIKAGDLVLMLAFGAGATWGTLMLQL